MRAPLAALLLWGSCACALAHGIYIAPRAGHPTVVLGHGAEDIGYAQVKLHGLRVAGGAGQPLAAPPAYARRQLSVELPEGAASITASYAGGWHGQTASGAWKPGRKGEHADVARVGEYHKHALFIASGSAQLPALYAAPLAVLPLQNPLVLQAGRTLAVRVLYRGQPLAGARVVGDSINASHTVSARTGRDGVARIPLRNQGLNVIAVTHAAPLDTADADFQEHVSTLSFVLPYADRH
jgi:nickel transport protein